MDRMYQSVDKITPHEEKDVKILSKADPEASMEDHEIVEEEGSASKRSSSPVKSLRLNVDADQLTLSDKKDLLKTFLDKKASSGGLSPVPEITGDGSCQDSADCGPQSGVSVALPEPDYPDSEEEARQMAVQAHYRPATAAADGLIRPRKLTNPCREDADRRELHRELVFNHKVGKNVIGQKSELQRAMERHKDQKERRETQLNTHKNSFERALEERLLRMEPKISDQPQSKLETAPEFLKVHAKMRANINTPS